MRWHIQRTTHIKGSYQILFFHSMTHRSNILSFLLLSWLQICCHKRNWTPRIFQRFFTPFSHLYKNHWIRMFPDFFFPKIFWKKLIAISRSWSVLLQSFFWSSHIPTTSHKRNCWKLEQDGPSVIRSTWSQNRPIWTICYLSVSKGGVWRYFWTSSNFNQGSASLFPVTQTSLFLSYFSSTAYFPLMLSLP